MELELLEIGIGVLEGEPTAFSYEDAASQLIGQILNQRRTVALPLRGIFLMATPDWCCSQRSISQTIREQFYKSLKYAPTLIGLSVPRAYASIPRGDESVGHAIENGIVLVAFFSNDLFITAEACEQPHSNRANRQSAVNKMVRRIIDRQREHIGLGSGSKSDLFAIFPGPFIDHTGQRVYFDSELHQEVLEAFGDQQTLFGGSAANDLEKPTLGYQFLDDKCLESSLVVASFEYDFEIDGRMDHGFQPVEHATVSVDGLATEGAERDYVVTVLDGKPALERLRELGETISFSTPRPVLGLGASKNAHIVTPVSPLPPLPEDGSLIDTSVRFNRPVTRGYRLSVLNATPQELHATAVGVFKSAFKSLDKKQNIVRLLFGMACIGRFVAYRNSYEGRHWWGAVSDFAQQYPTIPIVFGLVAGEFGQDLRRRPRADNLSLWITWFSAAPNPRSANRLRMLEMLKIADGLIQHGSVEAVMKAAIDRPMESLSLGGQICTVHSRFSKILGEGHGYSNSRPGAQGAQIDHEMIRRKTERVLAPKDTVYFVPPALRDWTMSTGVRQPSLSSNELDPQQQGVDILPFCVANGIAVFVPKPSNPLFMCDRHLASSAGLGPQFVMPLAGREGHVIATLQIFFERGHLMSREEMGHWVSYGQKVGVALDWAIQFESRASSTFLNRKFAEAMRYSDPRSPLPIGRVQDYLQHLQETLKADYVHIRIRERYGNDYRFRLVAPDGPFATEHRRVRPDILMRNEGSLFHLIERDQYSTSTSAETVAAYLRQPEHQRPALGLSGKWELLENEFNTFWMGALKSPNGEFLGCLVVHSKLDHFFTQYKDDLLTLACISLQTMLAKYESDYLNSPMKERESRLLFRALGIGATTHDLSKTENAIKHSAQLAQLLHPTDSNLQKLMETVCKNASIMMQSFANDHLWASATYTEMTMADLLGSAMEQLVERFTVPPAIELSTDDLHVLVHPAHVWVIRELIENAHVATEGTSYRMAIKVRGDEDDRTQVEITIENEGPDFTQLDIEEWRQEKFTTKKDSGHTGQGIPTAESIMSLMGGALALRPRDGGGVAATITLATAFDRR